MQALLVSRSGVLSAVEVNAPEEYYKSCGFRNPDGFLKRATWTIDALTVNLFAKVKGKAHSENTYEFPPPVEKSLFFGRCLLVSAESLTLAQWESMYETLMGGFEDLHTESESEDEEAEAELTAQGYEKDGFVVSDSELEEEPYV